jgi:hypothetical protein
MLGSRLGGIYLLLSMAVTSACRTGMNTSRAANPSLSHMTTSVTAPPIAQACALTPVSRALDAESGFPAVYVELAAVATAKGNPMPLAGQRPAGFLNTSDLEVLRVGSVMAKVGASATTAWDEAPTTANDASRTGCSKQSRFDLTLTLHSVDLQKRQLKLEITIVPAPPLGTPKDAWYVPEHRQMHTTVIVGDQQPLMLGGEAVSHHDTPSILVATPYIISASEHLNELFQCRLIAMAKAKAKAQAQ